MLWGCASSDEAGSPLDSGPSVDADAGRVDAGPVDTVAPDTAADTAMPGDGSGTPDTFTPEDTAQPPAPPLLPTWWDCRRALTSSQLTVELEATCDALYLEPPAARRYGIRWVFLTDVDDTEAWIAQKLALLDTAFGSTGFSFQTSSVLKVEDPQVTLAQGEEKVSFDELYSDVAAHLEVDETDPQAVFSLLKQRMQAVGVHAQTVSNLSMDKLWVPQEFHGTMARLRPEELYVMVVGKINAENTAGGLSSGPGPSPIAARVSVVNIKAGTVDAPAFPHEFGHYFGLKHPHGKRETDDPQVAFNFQDALEKVPIEADLVIALQETLTPTMDGPLGELYTPYTIQGQATQKSTAARYAIAQLYLPQRYTYRIGLDGPESFETLLDFVTHGASGEPLFYKNITQKPGPTQTSNNCYWDDVAGMIACDLGDPSQSFLGTDPMLAGSIVLDEGQSANIMSYIGKVLPTSPENLMVAYTPEQVQVMRVHANTPVRLLLRNHALESADP